MADNVYFTMVEKLLTVEVCTGNRKIKPNPAFAGIHKQILLFQYYFGLLD